MAQATPSSHLQNSCLNLVSLREHERNEFIRLLDSIKTKVALILDRELSGPLSLICEVSALKQHGVEQIYHLEPRDISTSCETILYCVRPRANLMMLIADQIHSHARKTPKEQHDYVVCFVPRRTMLCERLLVEKGIYGDLRLEEYELDLIPFEEDVLSLELGQSYRECFLEGDPSSLFNVARSLMKLQSMFGLFPRVLGKGGNAVHVFHLMRRMRREAASDQFSQILPECEALILLDRSVDMVTPLLTQLTYEGLIDEIFGIKNGFIDVEEEEEEATTAKEKPSKKKLPLNGGDTLFKEIRDLSFRVLGPLLRKRAAEIQQTYNERKSEMSVHQMGEFVKRFKIARKEHSFLQTHVNLAERIFKFTRSKQFDDRLSVEKDFVATTDTREDYVDTLIATKPPLFQALRTLCLLSLTHGLRERRFNALRKEIIHTYGFEIVLTLRSLERMGLLRSGGRPTWAAVRRAFNLFKPEVDFNSEKDASFALFNGYCPLSVRLVEAAFGPQGWRPYQDVMNLIGTPQSTFAEEQRLPPSLVERAKHLQARGEEHQRKPVVVVFFIGGVTFAEISALRMLGERMGREFVIATTKLINGNSLLGSVVDTIENNLQRKILTRL